MIMMRPLMHAFGQGSKRVKGDDTVAAYASSGDDSPVPMTSPDRADSALGGGAAILDDGAVSPGKGEATQAEGKPRGRGGRRGAPTSNERFQITADRPIFTLSVAADLLGLHPRTLRIYEEKKLVVPSRTDGNRRRYSQRDIQRFQSIRHLTSGGVNLEGVRIILELADDLTRLGGDPDEIIERNLQALQP